MRIAIDLTALLPEATGIDTYLKHLVLYLGRVDRQNQYKIFVNFEDRGVFDHMCPPNFAIVPVCFRGRFARLLFQQVGLPLMAAKWRASVVHSPSFIMPFFRGRQGHVLTVHDMTFFSLPQFHEPLRRSVFFRRAVLGSIRRTGLVIAPSQSSRQAILDILPELPPERLRVVTSGIGEEFQVRDPGDVQKAVDRLGLPHPYILYVGTIEPRKNLKRLVESYRKLVTTTAIPEHLVLAGRLGWGYKDLLAQLESPEIRGRVHLKGYIAQSDLPFLYAGARLFVYPSLQEGFGFPPLEAMACGIPTISSLSSSLTENLQGAAELIPPDDVDVLTDAITRMLRDEPLRARRKEQGLERAAQFRWEETARETLDCYRAVAQGRFR